MLKFNTCTTWLTIYTVEVRDILNVEKRKLTFHGWILLLKELENKNQVWLFLDSMLSILFPTCVQCFSVPKTELLSLLFFY